MTLTVPFAAEVGLARAVTRALVGTAFQGAVNAVPARDAETRPVLALSVHGAAVVAGLLLAAGAAPTGLTNASLVLASATEAK